MNLDGGTAGAILITTAMLAWLAGPLLQRGGPLLRRGGRQVRIGALIAAFALAAVPLGTLSLADYLRSLTGDPSITLVVLVSVRMIGYVRGVQLIGAIDYLAVAIAALAVAAFLYPTALGVGWSDPYSLGYRTAAFLPPLALAALAAWWAGLWFAPLCLVAAVAARTLDVLDSQNFWDYLIDPMLAGWALVTCLCALGRRAFSRRAVPS